MTGATKPTLYADDLLGRGFNRLGSWELDGERLRHQLDLAAEPGVYAFALDGIVQYVGLASRSIRQRLNFYRTPGTSQVTNVRLNATICALLAEGRQVDVLVAHPPAFDWNGFEVRGPEGLEAGLIGKFDLPWNVRGATAIMKKPMKPKSGRAERQSNVRKRILDQIRKRPGMTELELAKFIYGPAAQQQQANTHCRALVAAGLVERRGGGGIGDPYVYYPKR